VIIELSDMVVELSEREELIARTTDQCGTRYDTVAVGLYGKILSGVPKWMKVGDEFVLSCGALRGRFWLRDSGGQIRSTGRYEFTPEAT